MEFEALSDIKNTGDNGMITPEQCIHKYVDKNKDKYEYKEDFDLKCVVNQLISRDSYDEYLTDDLHRMYFKLKEYSALFANKDKLTEAKEIKCLLTDLKNELTKREKTLQLQETVNEVIDIEKIKQEYVFSPSVA